MTAMLALLITLFLTPIATNARDETVLVNEMAKLTVKYDHGALSILRVERLPLKSPERMRRWRGRFEARAVGGGKTLDFVRFDFPLMAEAEAPDDATEDAKKVGKTLREHVTATAIVRAPMPAGATSVAIYDSATKKSASADLAWTPTAPPAAGGGGSIKR
jgi:hypothetical protein